MAEDRPPIDKERPAGQPEGLAKPEDIRRKIGLADGNHIGPVAYVQPNRPPVDMKRPAGQPEGLAKPEDTERKIGLADGNHINPIAYARPKRPPVDMERPAGHPEGLARPEDIERLRFAGGHRTGPAVVARPTGQTETNPEGASAAREAPPAGPQQDRPQ